MRQLARERIHEDIRMHDGTPYIECDCSHCGGTGEGQREWLSCQWCRGKGIELVPVDDGRIYECPYCDERTDDEVCADCRALAKGKEHQQ